MTGTIAIHVPLVPRLTVCGIDELPGQRAEAVTRVLSILDPEHPGVTAFDSYASHSRTTLRFHDIIAAGAGMIMPQRAHVTEIIRFGEEAGASTVQEHVLVHCHMGVSRSTAAMLTLMARANPQEDAESLFRRLVAIRPQAWPNSVMVGFADDELGREGTLTAALRRHYGRQIVADPRFPAWMAELGRQREVDMAEPAT